MNTLTFGLCCYITDMFPKWQGQSFAATFHFN